MRSVFVALLLGLALGASPAAAQALRLCPVPGAAGDSAAAAPLLRLTASAEIREIRFESTPRIRIYLPGCPGNAVRTTERRNLPSPVEPGVTYRDVSAGVEISSYLQVTCNVPDGAGAIPGAAARELRAICGEAASGTTTSPAPPGQ